MGLEFPDLYEVRLQYGNLNNWQCYFIIARLLEVGPGRKGTLTCTKFTSTVLWIIFKDSLTFHLYAVI